MQFRTKINPADSSFKINHTDSIFSIGSCFAENIGSKLNNLKFQNHLNPFGILYNPISILNCLNRLTKNTPFTENELVENNGLWHSFEHHGSFSKIDKTDTLKEINNQFKKSVNRLKNTNRLVLTFGTANVFIYKPSEKIVANCHKIPNKQFEKRRLSIKEIVDDYIPFLKNLKSQNTDLEAIMTVSPIRHIRDGIIENQRSKSVLLLAIEEICHQLNFVTYFPSYEILMDDLRDYRFYNSDMIHPNETALQYIWQLFSQTYFDSKTQNLIQKIEKIKAAVNHRPIHPNSIPHQQFLKSLIKKIEGIEKEFPFLSFEEEKEKLTT